MSYPVAKPGEGELKRQLDRFVVEAIMLDALKDQLGKALSKIDRPSAFCASGHFPAVLPGLVVKDVGPVGLPLTDGQARKLKKYCHQAPHGKGVKTIVDTNVRRVWRLEPDQFSLTNPHWQAFIEQIVERVQVSLGLEKQKLTSHLYDLLLYEPRSFFLPHRDGEKLDRMVATLVVTLPSAHEGGELVIRHDGNERTIAFGGAKNMFDIHYAAFYADCEHEVRPLSKGHRLCLVYNLTLAKSKTTLAAPRTSEHIERIVSILRDWAADESADKLVVTLDHQYTKEGLAPDALKGADRAKADVLLEAAGQAGCRAYLGLLTLWQSGSLDDYDEGYSYRGRRSRGNMPSAHLHKMGEVYESSLTAENLSDRTGLGLPIPELPVQKADLLDPDTLTKVVPDEEYEGYTGNEGMTVDHWYRHAAIVIWPERQHFAAICGKNSPAVIPYLKQMVALWQKASTADKPHLKAACVQLANAVMAKWPSVEFNQGDGREVKDDELLPILAMLDEPTLVGNYLGRVLAKDARIEPGKTLAKVCNKCGWTAHRRALSAVIKHSTSQTIGRNARWLEHLCLAEPKCRDDWLKVCGSLANDLLSALETMDRATQPNDWRARPIDRTALVARLVRSILAVEQFDLLERLVAHALDHTAFYPLRDVQIQALIGLESWLKKNVTKPCPALAKWVAVCREQLESWTAELPQAPTDYRRSANISCQCEYCASLKKFLTDPEAAVGRFSVRQDLRDHLQHNIRTGECNVTCETVRSRSPHTLVCTKTTASFQKDLKRYHLDRDHLATLRSIESRLPH